MWFPLLLLPCALLTSDRLAGAALLAGVRARALAVYRQVPAVALAAVAVDLHQPRDVLPHFTPEVTFDDVVLVDVIANLDDVVVRQFAGARVRVQTGITHD